MRSMFKVSIFNALYSRIIPTSGLLISDVFCYSDMQKYWMLLTQCKIPIELI